MLGREIEEEGRRRCGVKPRELPFGAEAPRLQTDNCKRRKAELNPSHKGPWGRHELKQGAPGLCFQNVLGKKDVGKVSYAGRNSAPRSASRGSRPFRGGTDFPRRWLGFWSPPSPLRASSLQNEAALHIYSVLNK